jgi:hypothetical protein
MIFSLAHASQLEDSAADFGFAEASSGQQVCQDLDIRRELCWASARMTN